MSDKSRQRETIHLFITTSRLLRKNVENILGKIGWQHTRHRILIHLADHNKNPSQREIADFLKISPAAVAVTLSKMENDGLIERKISKDDNRINKINITSSGMRMIKTAKHIFNTTDIALLQGFSQEELKLFTGYLDRLQKNIKAMDTEAIVNLGKEMIAHEKMDEIY